MRTEAAQLRLLTWFSPAFPVGAFGWSHGLENAIREGAVATAYDLRAWIEGLVEYGSGWTDAVLFRAAWEARDAVELADIAELAAALAPSFERRRESLGQGAAFLKAVEAWFGAPPQDPPPLGEHLDTPYAVVAGAVCAAAGVPLAPALVAWLHGFAANLVSVALRAIPLGQNDGVAVIAALEPSLLATAERAQAATLEDLGGCAFLSDIAAMRHETLQPRLFLS